MMPSESGVTAISEPQQGQVLVIEDDDLVRQSLGTILHVYGLKALFAASGNEAIRLLQTQIHEIGVVLLDVSLPDMPGEVVFQKIRELREELPVIVMSGHSEGAIMVRFPVEPNVMFLSKPSPIHEMISKIHRALGKQA